MKYFEFDYLKNFNCIGGACKHNCCIGWQISIDKKSLDKYKTTPKTDERLNEKTFNGNNFSLDDNGRCLLLDEDNLCHLIKKYGKGYLCKTCSTHPRFKNFFSGVTETGLGLYCEEACSIILAHKGKTKLVLVKNDGKESALSKFEKQVMAFRKKVDGVINDKSLTISQKLDSLSSLADVNLNKKSFTDWLKVFGGLEKLSLNEFSFDQIPLAKTFNDQLLIFEKEYVNLLSYLNYRHVSRAIDLLDLRVRLAFVILCFKFINHLVSLKQNPSFSDLVETCRFFTSEIECNDDNIFTLLNEIESLISFV